MRSRGQQSLVKLRATQVSTLAGLLTIPRAAVTEIGVDFSQVGEMTYEEWASVGPGLSAVGNFSKWALGDWLNAGEARYGEKYSQAINDLGKDYGSLANIAWVCRMYPIAERRKGLSWSIHRMAAALGEEDRGPALDVAETGGNEGAPMTASQFARYLKDAGLVVPRKKEEVEEEADVPDVTWTADGLWGYARCDAKILRALYDACQRTGETFISLLEQAVERLTIALSDVEATETEAVEQTEWEYAHAEGMGEEVPEVYEGDSIAHSEHPAEEVPA